MATLRPWLTGIIYLGMTATSCIALINGCKTASSQAALQEAAPAPAQANDPNEPDDGDEGSNYWTDESSVAPSAPPTPPPTAEETRELLKSYTHTFSMQDSRGHTYLAFMKTKVKPAMDKLATAGYPVASGATVDIAYRASDGKIKNRVANTWGGLEKVRGVVGAISGQTVTLHDLPDRIRSQAPGIDAYGLATYVGLASGGGVNVKYTERNYGLNVHYDVTDQKSGRSFGVGPTRGANDASDIDYLTGLQRYTRDAPDNQPAFYRALFESILDCNPAAYAEVSPEGQTVLTDFLAVFTAEQARNLMDGYISPHWDAALLEVTLLAAFHSGQEQVKLFYRNPGTGKTSFTDRTLKQKACTVPSSTKTAALTDYWQFSRNVDDPSNCRRSGINVTKKEFRRLGAAITSYLRQSHPDLYQRVAASISTDHASNLFSSLSYFLISNQTPDSFAPDKVREITDAWVELLQIARQEAPAITQFIDQQS